LIQEFASSPVESGRPVEEIAAGADVVAQAAIRVNVGQSYDLIADDRKGRVVIEIENALQETIRDAGSRSSRCRKRIHITGGARSKRWQHVHPILRGGSQHRGGDAGNLGRGDDSTIEIGG